MSALRSGCLRRHRRPTASPWVDSGAKAGTDWATTTNYIEIFPIHDIRRYRDSAAASRKWRGMPCNHCPAPRLGTASSARCSTLRAAIKRSAACRSVSNDFADSYYSLDDVSGDNSMTNFSLHRDSTKLIPFIRAAQAYKPNLRFWASPWTPPSWMKNNNYYCNVTPGNSTTAAQNSMKSDATTLTAYALYLSKAVQEFKKAGINIEFITCQNEPDQIDHNYPTCGWSYT